MSYIVIHNPKLIIELSEDIDYLEEDEEHALDKLINSDPNYIRDIVDTKIIDLTIREIHILFTAYDMVYKIGGLDIDKLLIYWLTTKDIDFEIEDHINIEEFRNNGYNIIKFEKEE